jgi:hypothetical protein
MDAPITHLRMESIGQRVQCQLYQTLHVMDCIHWFRDRCIHAPLLRLKDCGNDGKSLNLLTLP